MNNPKKILFIINPISGIGKQKVVEGLVSDILPKTDFDINIEYTQHAKHAIDISKDNVTSYDIIVSVGGDGSINEIARGLINTKTTLAIIPTGSGNGLARHLNIPLNIKKAIELIKTGKVKKIDAVQLNNEYFFCTAGAGFDAKVAWKFAEASKRGFWTYTKIVTKSIFAYRPERITITSVDGDTTFDNALIATFANANQFGNNVIISPNSKIDDGYIRFVTIDKIPIIYYPAFAFYLLTKKLYNFKYYKETKAKELTIFIANNKIHIDGEPIEIENKIELKTLPSSLNVIVP